MKETLSPQLRALPAYVRGVHDRPEGRRGARHRGPAPGGLHGVQVGGDPELLAAVQQPVVGGRLRGRRAARRRRRPVRARQRRRDDHGAAGPGLLDPHRPERRGPAERAAARAATRSSTTQTSPPRSSRSRPNFKRAMEGELSKTIEAIDGVEHRGRAPRAARRRRSSPTSRTPATASVLVDTAPGADLDPEQVQAVVNLVASSIDGLDPDKVTVADSTGTGALVPTTAPAAPAPAPATQQVADFQTELQARSRRCSTGSSARATPPCRSPPTSTSTRPSTEQHDLLRAATTSARCPRASSSETYTGADQRRRHAERRGRARRPDGRRTRRHRRARSLRRSERGTQDNAVDSIVEQREAAPGSVEGCTSASSSTPRPPGNVDPGEVAEHDRRRRWASTPSAATRSRSPRCRSTARRTRQPPPSSRRPRPPTRRPRRWTSIRNGGTGSPRRGPGPRRLAQGTPPQQGTQAEATTYVVEQLRQREAERRAHGPARAALEHAAGRCWPSSAPSATSADEMRDELAALVERQPEDVAALLRGWLVEKADDAPPSPRSASARPPSC